MLHRMIIIVMMARLLKGPQALSPLLQQHLRQDDQGFLVGLGFEYLENLARTVTLGKGNILVTDEEFNMVSSIPSCRETSSFNLL